MSFSPRIGIGSAFYARMQAVDTMLNLREGVLTASLAEKVAKGDKNLGYLANDVLRIQTLRKKMGELKSNVAQLHREVDVVSKRISHKVWIFPEESVADEQAYKKQKVAELAQAVSVLEKIYGAHIKD